MGRNTNTATSPDKISTLKQPANTLDSTSDDPDPASPSNVREDRGQAPSWFVSPPKTETRFQIASNATPQSELLTPESPALRAAQRTELEGAVDQVHDITKSCLGPRAALNTAPRFSGGSVLPSSSSLSAHSDECQWDSIFPESITYKLKLLLRDKRPVDKAPHSKHLATEGPQSLQWYEKATYKSDKWLFSSSQRGHELHETLQDNTTRESYIRYGICRVIGTKHEACEELEDPDQLEEKAISLICGFIHDHKYERFHLEIIWEYATVKLQKIPHEKYAQTIASEISSKIVQNYVRKSYIPRKDLVRIMSPEVIRQIIDEDDSSKENAWTDDQRTEFAIQVQQHCSRLQAVCIYQGLPMKFLKHLMDHGIRDIDPPDEVFEDRHLQKCSERNCPTHMTKFFEMYHGFFAHKFDPDGEMQIFTEAMVLPLYYVGNEKNSRLGYGAASNVYEVKIDPVHHSLSNDRNSAFALKIFHNRDKTEAAFRREKDMIEKLAKCPHEHITPYLATWTQGGHPCILFPRAKHNLRTFMSNTEEPKLTPRFVLWFLKQLKGLASAVAHFHWISDDPRETGRSPGVRADTNLLGGDLKQNKQKQMGLAGVHHDIKAENILVFEKEATQSPYAGVFKISDFGAGRFANLALGQISAPLKASKGTLTYKAPEEKPSRPFDMWALGCVYLELLIWALTGEQDGGKGFSDRRGFLSDPRPGDAKPTRPDDVEATRPDDLFWVEDPITHQIKLRGAVSQQIKELTDIYCKGKKAFCRVTSLTSRLFTIKPWDRPVARDVVEELEKIYREASDELENDPRCYVRDYPRKTSDSLSASNASNNYPVPALFEPESSRDRSLKRAADDVDEYESEEESFQYLKRRRTTSGAGRAPPASEAKLDLVGPTTSTQLEVQGAESEDDALRNVGPEDTNRRGSLANHGISRDMPWQLG